MERVSNTLNSIKSAYDLAKDLKDNKSITINADGNMKIIELMGALVDAKEELVEIKSQIIDKDKLIMELQGKLETKESLKYEEPFYWKKIEGNQKEGPFCQKCQDAEGRMARLIAKPDSYAGTHHCSVCDNWYGEETSYSTEDMPSAAW